MTSATRFSTAEIPTKEEARRYAQLSEAEHEALWNEGADSIDAEDEGDELEFPAS